MHLGWFYMALIGLTADLLAGLSFLAGLGVVSVALLVVAGVCSVTPVVAVLRFRLLYRTGPGKIST